MSITPEYLYDLANDPTPRDALIAAADAIRQLRENAKASKAEIERLRADLVAAQAELGHQQQPMKSADVLSVFAPLPENEAAALREVMDDDGQQRTCVSRSGICDGSCNEPGGPGCQC